MIVKQILFFIVVFYFFTGCLTKYPELKTVENVNIPRYLGKWYEIARFDHSFETKCENVNATYSIRDDGKIKVVNECVKNGKISQAVGKAYAVDETNSKLKVSFFGPFYGDYWILMLDDDYSFAVVGAPSRKYFWILSRQKQIDQSTKDEILKKMPLFGFAPENLIWTKQN